MGLMSRLSAEPRGTEKADGFINAYAVDSLLRILFVGCVLRRCG